jgi:RHS repeat-associated protein
MIPPPRYSARRIIVKSSLWIAMLILGATHVVTVRADSTDGTTPLALKPGVPAGSYALSGLDTVNPYNGSLNFRLPLLGLGGRGGAAYTMTLPLEQKWRINTTQTYLYVYADGGGPPLPDPEVTYHYFPSANWWSGIKPGYGPGVMQGRVAQFDAQVCPDSTMRARLTLTRLTFTAPDGTEFELRDRQSDGAPAGVGICDTTGYNRGRVFVTADGSAATFVSDLAIVDYIVMPNDGNDLFYPSGYLLMRDGTRYRIDNGMVTWLRDRNGNRMTFTYDSFKRMTLAKDSLNREVTVSYSTASIAYDEISYKGFGGAQRTIRVNYANLQDAGSLRSGFSIQTYGQLFPEVSGSGVNNYNPKVVRSVTLLNNQQYQFQYNSYGELARVVLPTGGAFEYDYAAGVAGAPASGVISGGFDDYSMNVYRRVVTRRSYDDGSTMSAKTTFSRPESTSGNSSYILIDQFKSDGTTRISQQKVYHEGFATSSFTIGPTEYSPWKEGRELQSESIAADGTTVLNRTVRTWEQPTAGNSWPLVQTETNAAAKANNPQVTQIVTTLEPAQANKVSKQTFTYDKYSNGSDVYEFDFGTGAPGSLVRRSHTDYLTSSYDTLNPSPTSPDMSLTTHIRNLPTQSSVFDAGGVERARSTTEYDNYVLDGTDCQHSFHCSLLPRSNISGLDSSFTTSYTKRGNPTAVTRYLMSGGAVTSSISTYSQYDVAGNVVRVLDPRSTLSTNIATTIEYDDRFGTPNSEARSNTAPAELTGFTSFALPTKVINALGQTAYAQFDYYLGKPVNGEDANGCIASGSYSDSLDRPTQIKRGIGTSAENQTTFAYDDTNRTITTSSDQNANGDNVLVSKVLYDQMGRTIETRQYEGGSNYIVTQTQYDALSRAFKTSNPYRLWQSQSAVWTTQAFDALGRVISVTTPDNAVVSTSYSGNSVTVTDQAGKARKSVKDALGRLSDVYEDPAGLNYQTTYLYDVLDNLVKVTQGSQQRFFMYDSLRRVIRSRNPEQSTLTSLSLSDPLTGNSAWSIGYQYDVNGNLTQKTDPRGVVSTYVYDALNRNTTTDYSDTASINPDVKRFYDGATNGIGRFWYAYSGGDYSTGTNVDHTSIDSYDALGSPLVQRQLFKLNGVWSPTYQMSRTYNRAGAVKTQTYPSGHSVTYNYDSAGRLGDKDGQNLAFTGNLGDGSLRTYAAGISYSPWGSLSAEQFGTNTALYDKRQYNIRGQLFDTRLSSVNDVWDWNRGRLILYYSGNHLWGQSGTDNNGNVRYAENWIPPENATLDQADTLAEDSYDYDPLNRLSSVTEQRMSASGGWVWQQQFKQAYSYDQWGNRTINAAQTWGTGITNKQFTVETVTNRLLVPVGQSGAMSYDAAGNLTTDTYTGYGNRVYDAENKITSAQDSYAGTSYYAYDADGRRTRRKCNNQETWQIYGFGSELLAEYAANAAAASPQKEYGYRNGELLVTAEALTNVALPANGATVSASSTHVNPPFSYPVSAVNNGDRKGLNAGYGGNWTSPPTFPQWVQVDFNGSKTISEIDVFSLQDNYASPIEPTEMTTFSLYGLTGFDLQYWNGSTWATVPGGSVTGNNKVWKKVTFAAIATTKIRVLINATSDGSSRMVELEAWTSTSSNINWLVTDHLGTPRIIVDKTGSLTNVKRHDYLPFGEELFAGTGGRTAGLGYSGGYNVRQQFTQKERDIESGLDYFGARYYASVQGRFTSADDFLNDTHVVDPASWNLYTYVRNNPLRYVDPLGQDVEITLDKNRKLTEDQKKAIEKDLQAKTGLTSIHFDQNGRLTYDRNERAQGGSAQLRQNILGAIDDPTNLFQIGDYSNSDNIQFAATDEGSVDLTTGITTYQVKIDFADFQDARNLSDTGALDAFSVGLNLDHEIDHKVSYDPNNPLPPGGRGDGGPNGVIADVNVAQSQLGLATRAPDSHTGQPYKGPDSRLKNTYQIQFNASGKAKFLRWKLENQR